MVLDGLWCESGDATESFLPPTSFTVSLARSSEGNLSLSESGAAGCAHANALTVNFERSVFS